MNMPLCYRFDPTDEEIILHYLYNKTHGFPLSSSSAVIECDLYDETDAWKKFFEATTETTLYFFTKLRKKSEKSSRAERATGSGTWRTQNDKDLYNGGDRRQPIGYKRSFSFIPKKNAQEKGKWVMNEYRLHGSLLMNKKSDLVVCRIKKKVTKEERRNRSKLTRNNNCDSSVGGEQIVSEFQEGMNMGALDVEKSDYIDDNNQSLTVEDVEVMKTKGLGFTMEEIEGGSNQKQECYTNDYGGNYNVNSKNPVSGEQKAPQGFGMMGGALEGKQSDYVNNSSLGFTMKDLEGTDKAGRILEDLDAAYWSWRNQISTQECYTSHDQHCGMGGLQVEESAYIIDSNQEITMEEIDMVGTNNQREHLQKCYVSEANVGNSVNSKNGLDSENIVSRISEENAYIIDSNQGITMEEIDMIGSNNQTEHMQECYISEANGGNSVKSKNCSDNENIVSGISEEMMRALAETDDYIDNNSVFMMDDCVNNGDATGLSIWSN